MENLTNTATTKDWVAVTKDMKITAFMPVPAVDPTGSHDADQVRVEPHTGAFPRRGGKKVAVAG